MEEGRDAGRGCGDGWVEIKEKRREQDGAWREI